MPILQIMLLIGAAVALTLLAACGPATHPDVGFQIAHAAAGDSGSGCTKCHQTPISATCTTCHPSPPTLIGGGTIVFPHHDVASGKPITNCQMCHTSADGDARYVKVIKPLTMNFCKQCHQLTHTGP